MKDKTWMPVRVDDVLAVGETEKALQIRTDDGRQHWIPKKLIHDDSEVYEVGHEGTLVVPEWLAAEKELL